jgi:hypothetical protein
MMAIGTETDCSYLYTHENERFGMSLSHLQRIDNTDTLMMFVQDCGLPMHSNPDFCTNLYFPYISLLYAGRFLRAFFGLSEKAKKKQKLLPDNR